MAKADAPPRAKRERDIRLDVFRGLAMGIILIAHIPNNPWTLWIPARFGFSDATEMFVFCSGMASAFAFGKLYLSSGWKAGTARVTKRVGQVYSAHILLFFLTLSLVIALTALAITGRDYVGELNLYPFLTDGSAWSVWVNRVSLFTLTYVPNYFDILPMYLIVLTLLPLMMALAGVSVWLAFAFSVALWFGAQAGILWMPAEPWTDREWFFNPFGWQLLFFTGFAFVLGWLPKPSSQWWLVGLSFVFVVVSVPAAWFRLHQSYDWALAYREVLWPFMDKTDFGILRYLHFLALAYLAYIIAGEGGARFRVAGEGVVARFIRWFLGVVQAIGQQALIVFVTSMVLAQALGFVLDLMGRTMLTVLLVNVFGLATLYGVARVARWVKKRPHRLRAAPATA
ncbi:MAG: OpgC domain-containing protein [Pseudomonadota bacterium]